MTSQPEFYIWLGQRRKTLLDKQKQRHLLPGLPQKKDWKNPEQPELKGTIKGITQTNIKPLVLIYNFSLLPMESKRQIHIK